uniref:Putative specific protein n=1 Tax=Helicobacter pylori TaxID=210 RepID=Q8VTD3_HELPX|nr:putative specific protein [Helicobacter pylori]
MKSIKKPHLGPYTSPCVLCVRVSWHTQSVFKYGLESYSPTHALTILAQKY